VYFYPGTGTVDGVRGDHIIVAPAYNVTDAELNTMVERIVKTIQDVFYEEDILHPVFEQARF
jgi:adenosylmethionine-8-amino-7-oxononanoate aminotransferase